MTAVSHAQRRDFLAAERPHGVVFPRLAVAADAAGWRLTDEQVARYRADGFVHRVPILTAAQLARVRDALDAILQRRNGREDEIAAPTADAATTPLTYLQGAWTIDEVLHDLVFHPAITVKVAQLLETTRVRFWHDQVFAKPPRIGGNVAWHQDYSYWRRSAPARHCTAWIGLDDSTLENGCVHMVPGSQRWGLLEPENLMGDMEALRRQLGPDHAARFAPVPLEQPAGTCSFHHDHTIHGSYRNESPRPRRAIVLNYMADGVRSAADDGVMMPGYPAVAKGEVIGGRAFPLVIDLAR